MFAAKSLHQKFIHMATALQLNTANPDAITYQTEEILYTILGGIRLEGLDRLRVTIKVDVINRKFQHYLRDGHQNY